MTLNNKITYTLGSTAKEQIIILISAIQSHTTFRFLLNICLIGRSVFNMFEFPKHWSPQTNNDRFTNIYKFYNKFHKLLTKFTNYYNTLLTIKTPTYIIYS